jgi:hypothetical protein
VVLRADCFGPAGAVCVEDSEVGGLGFAEAEEHALGFFGVAGHDVRFTFGVEAACLVLVGVVRVIWGLVGGVVGGLRVLARLVFGVWLVKLEKCCERQPRSKVGFGGNTPVGLKFVYGNSM